MSMIHRAFVFDDRAFRAELHGILAQALRDGDVTALRAFIVGHADELSDPDDGAPLAPDWESRLAYRRAEHYGDIALTRYYRPDDDVGLGVAWQAIGELLAQHGLGEAIVLGRALDGFDPGKQGAYVQSPEMVAAHLRTVGELVRRTPGLAAPLAPLRSMLEAAAEQALGLYVTF